MTKHSGRSGAPTEPVDWFANVTRVDLVDDRAPGHATDGSTSNDANTSNDGEVPEDGDARGGTDPVRDAGPSGNADTLQNPEADEGRHDGGDAGEPQAVDKARWKTATATDADAEPPEQTGPGRNGLMVLVPVLATAAILAIGFLLFANEGSDDAGRTAENNADAGDPDAPAAPTAQDGAEAGTEPDGSLDRPYPFGLMVTLNYNDLGQGHNREWRVQVLESNLDGATPEADATVMARVRLTYVDGTAPARTDDIVLRAVGASGSAYPSDPDTCAAPDDGIPNVELEQGQAVEGRLCWPVPADDRSGLVLSVEAEPADGVLYMTLDSQGVALGAGPGEAPGKELRNG